mmetsp:Transcript_22418/g.68309  ORF Transcript_22418/g.68309 Transcript_22418/m.68309 type:complete len:97 (-) Transcript_22418:1334-1624(-)
MQYCFQAPRQKQSASPWIHEREAQACVDSSGKAVAWVAEGELSPPRPPPPPPPPPPHIDAPGFLGFALKRTENLDALQFRRHTTCEWTGGDQQRAH